MHIKFRPVGYLILTAIMAVILTCPLTARADSAGEWNNKGLALGNLGRYQEAISCVDTALDLNNKIVNPYGWSNKGWILQKMGMTPVEVLECYEKALAIDPKYVPSWSEDETPLAETPEYKQAKGAVDGR